MFSHKLFVSSVLVLLLGMTSAFAGPADRLNCDVIAVTDFNYFQGKLGVEVDSLVRGASDHGHAGMIFGKVGYYSEANDVIDWERTEDFVTLVTIFPASAPKDVIQVRVVGSEGTVSVSTPAAGMKKVADLSCR